ncbi:hypothetical protein ACWGR4_26425 [Embleya sp. NPDC055664]
MRDGALIVNSCRLGALREDGEDVLEVGGRGGDFTDEGGVGVEFVVDEVRAVAVLGWRCGRLRGR